MAEIYVNIATISGDCTDTGFDDQIKCETLRHAIAHTIKSKGGRKEGNSRHGAIELTHRIDKATPALHVASADATNVGDVTITRVNSEGTVETIELKNAYVVRVDIDTPLDPETLLPDEMEPIETFALEYSQIRWKWNDGNIDGSWNKSIGAVLA